MFNFLPKIVTRRELNKALDTASTKLNQFEVMTTALQSQVDILTLRPVGARKYLTKVEQVSETVKKFKSQAKFGNQILQRIINLRVAFSMPNRLFLMPNSDLEKDTSVEDLKDAKAYLSAFMTLNGLNANMPRDMAKEAELRGQVALGLFWDDKEKNCRLSYYPCDSVAYKVKEVKQYQLNGKKKLTCEGTTKLDLSDDEFVFIAFNDQMQEYEGYPTVAGILETIENTDKDLIDWRRLNHLFAHPTPHFKCETQEDAEAVNTLITKVGWKVGTALATNSELKLVGTTGVEANLLMLSITTNAKIISGHTGIAIHFLGFANVMSNRSVADDLGEPTEVVLHSEITSWNSFYTELFQKAIRMRNAELHGQMSEDSIIPKIIPLTDKQYELIKEVYMPLVEAKQVSSRTLLEQIPGLDVEQEEARLEKEFKEAEARIVKEPESKLENDDENKSAEEIAAAEAKKFDEKKISDK